MDYKLQFADVQFKTMKVSDISKVIWKPNSKHPDSRPLFFPLCQI